MMPIIESQAQRDALIKRANGWISLCNVGHISELDKLDMELAQIALTALEVEPTAWGFKFDDEAVKDGAEPGWQGAHYGDKPEYIAMVFEPLYRNLPVPVLKPVVLPEVQTFPDFPGDEWLWKPAVIKAILESGSTVAGEE